jgi:two-component system, sensor histidine kinase and response regulator
MPSEIVNILLVDDKPENLVVLEELLKQPERCLLTATSGNDALRLLLKHEVAVVLLDVEMPGMDGYETAQLMRSVEATKLIPIIFVTAGDRSEERTFRGYEVGAVDFLYKPVNAHTLRSKVNVFVDLFRKTRELERVNAALERVTASLQEKVSDLESVAQTVSHDLRAPLRSVRAFSEILAEQLAGKLDGEAADALDRVLRGAERMGTLLDDLYRLLRLSSQEVPTDYVDLAAVMRDVMENLRADLEQAGATVTHGELPTVRGNATLLGQIFQNLIANAIKFRGAEPPAVHITATRLEDAWQIAVRDNGIGIPPEDRERVFELFQRLSSEKIGTGVGLALCKRAVEKLGGRIWVAPQDGRGTTFCFTIPHDRARARAAT